MIKDRQPGDINRIGYNRYIVSVKRELLNGFEVARCGEFRKKSQALEKANEVRGRDKNATIIILDRRAHYGSVQKIVISPDGYMTESKRDKITG